MPSEARDEIEGAALAARDGRGHRRGSRAPARRARARPRAAGASPRSSSGSSASTALEGQLGELERKRAALADATPIEPSAIVELENARDARATASERAERARRAADAVEPALAEAEGRLREIDTIVAMHEAYRDGPDGAGAARARDRARPPARAPGERCP